MDSNTISDAISLLENKEIDYLHKEPILVRYLEELLNIFKFVSYNYPNTIKEYIENDSDDHYHADKKQGHYYSICNTFDDVIYQFHFSWESRINKVRGFKDNINNKRNKLSDNRIEELRVACIVLTEEIRNFVCSSTSGDENYVDELEYIKKLKRANEIVQLIIKL